jgi:hypothetical protein
MRKIFGLIFFFGIIYGINASGNKSIEADFYNVLDDIIETLERTRELCIQDMHPIYVDYHEYFIEKYRNHLIDISSTIENNRNLFIGNIAVKTILDIIEFEINNILNMENYEINSSDVLRKIEIIIELIISVFTIKYYEGLMNDNNLQYK